jgi:Tfp pilus assembly protein PilE
MNTKGFTLIYLMMIIVIIMILFAISANIYLRFRFKANVAQAIKGLATIRGLQEVYKAEHDIYIACDPSPPDGGTDAKPDAWTDAGGFTLLGFVPDGPVRYQYAVYGATTKTYTATATGDMDKNGTPVVYSVTESQSQAQAIPAGEL